MRVQFDIMNARGWTRVAIRFYLCDFFALDKSGRRIVAVDFNHHCTCHLEKIEDDGKLLVGCFWGSHFEPVGLIASVVNHPIGFLSWRYAGRSFRDTIHAGILIGTNGETRRILGDAQQEKYENDSTDTSS